VSHLGLWSILPRCHTVTSLPIEAGRLLRGASSTLYQSSGRKNRNVLIGTHYAQHLHAKHKIVPIIYVYTYVALLDHNLPRGLTEVPYTSCVRIMASETLMQVRTKFVEKVTGPTLSLLLDDLLMDGVFNEGEMEQVKEEFRMRAEKARAVIDMTRKKGNAASDKLIARLQQRDPSLFQDLGLVA
uniref:CARD domain-containing protein n=1 Tax=Paramormyrops kingsleyae TaxID=1676925 RepID=A0A3B3SWQ1_9TELE